MNLSKDKNTLIKSKKKLELYHGQLIAVKDLMAMRSESAEQKEMSEPTAEHLPAFPVIMNTKYSMSVSHFISSTDFWVCAANNQARTSLHSLLL
jgi:hypothetical protein